MAIRALCIVKNEADVIAPVLSAASRWCDQIYLFDNGSRDGTWEQVHALARTLPAIVPFKQEGKPFTDSLRDEILRHYRRCARRGDWWCILDADEFYIDDPRAFLAQVPAHYRAVWPQRYTYLFTDTDAAAYRNDPSRYAPDVPLEQRLRHYVLGDYTELRFFRHDPQFDAVPVDVQPIYPRRIRSRHYMYRSPEQIQMRFDTRREPMQRGEFVHEKKANWQPDQQLIAGPATPSDLPTDWEERIVPHTDCHIDRGVETLLPPLAWTPPEPRQATPRKRGKGLRGVLRRIARRIARVVRARDFALGHRHPSDAAAITFGKDQTRAAPAVTRPSSRSRSSQGRDRADADAVP